MGDLVADLRSLARLREIERQLRRIRFVRVTTRWIVAPAMVCAALLGGYALRRDSMLLLGALVVSANTLVAFLLALRRVDAEEQRLRAEQVGLQAGARVRRSPPHLR